ncbi:hypothetical protein DICSQDRAFT_15853, partial [Dichomitus squalens LYAD-421 SS1]|uniref:uncharacterized protein n=1 Tax=Dichomitus squalens (strain LYAD-421) TaxID=732165 RepID=UPI0004414A3E
RITVHGQYATGQSDGWKNIAKTSVLTSTMNVNWLAHLVRTHDMTGRPKTGQEHLEVIKSDIEYMETTYGVRTIAWVTDDGPDGKGARNLLRKLWPWMVLLLCWAHQCNLLVGEFLVLDPYRNIMAQAVEIAKWFNNHSGALDLLNVEQLATYRDRPRALALLLPVVTRWTAHLHAAERVLQLKLALECVIMKHRDRLKTIASFSRAREGDTLIGRIIATIENKEFWVLLARVTTHLKPLAIATNILQSSHARLDHVLFTLANLYHTYNQDLFILAGFLNPYVRASCFNRKVLCGQDIVNLAIRVFKRLFECDPEASFSDAVEAYMYRQGHYTDAAMNLAGHLSNAKDKEVDILRIWKLADRSNADNTAICTDENGLPKLARRLLSVAVSTGDTERVFSDFGITHTRRCNRLSPETVHKISVVRKSLRRAHAAAGLLVTRMKRKLTS